MEFYLTGSEVPLPLYCAPVLWTRAQSWAVRQEGHVRVWRCCGEARAALRLAVSRAEYSAHSHRLMSPCLIPVCSAAHPLVKTCPANGPIGGDLAWTGSDVPASLKCTVSPQILSTTSSSCECRQGVPAAPLRRDASPVNIQTDKSAPDSVSEQM